MTVISRAERDTLEEQLRKRFEALLRVIEPRDLIDDGEGCSEKRWPHPEQMCVVSAGTMEWRLAVDDFESILRRVSYLN